MHTKTVGSPGKKYLKKRHFQTLDMDLWLIEQQKKRIPGFCLSVVDVRREFTREKFRNKIHRLPVSNGPWLVISNHLKRRTQAELLIPPNKWKKELQKFTCILVKRKWYFANICWIEGFV